MSKDYTEIMAEPLPRSEDFGYIPPDDWQNDRDALFESTERFKQTEGYWLWHIAMSKWMIRREQAELDRQADSEGAYAEWVRRNNPYAIAYEQRCIEEYEGKLEATRKGCAA